MFLTLHTEIQTCFNTILYFTFTSILKFFLDRNYQGSRVRFQTYVGRIQGIQSFITNHKTVDQSAPAMKLTVITKRVDISLLADLSFIWSIRSHFHIFAIEKLSQSKQIETI